MRVTKSIVPESELDSRLFKYYDIPEFRPDFRNYQKARDNYGVRTMLKKSIYNDFGYDVYSVFEDATENNFLKYFEMYSKRVEDYSSYFISSFTRAMSEDIEREEALKNFIESPLYKEIHDKFDNSLDRTEELLKLMKDGSNGEGMGSPGSSSVDDSLKMLSEMSKVVDSKEQLEKLIKTIDDNRQISDSKKRELKRKLEKLSNGFTRLSNKEKENLLQNIMDMMFSIDLVEYMALNVGNMNQITSTFKAEDEYLSSKLPIDGYGIKKMKRSEEIARVNPMELALDDDIFYARVLNNDVIVKDYLQKAKVGQAMYVLIDVSGSMGGIKEMFSKSVILKLIDKVIEGEAMYYMREFDDDVFELHKAHTKQEAEYLKERFQNVDFNGGGTHIDKAIKVAIADFKREKEKFKNMDLLLITDGTDDINISKKELGDIKLHTFCIDNTELKKDEVVAIEKYLREVRSDADDKRSESVIKAEMQENTNNKSFSFHFGALQNLSKVSTTFSYVNPKNEIEKEMPVLGLALNAGGRNYN